MEIRLPSEKLQKLRNLITEFMTKDKCTRRELEDLAGDSAHARQEVRGALYGISGI